MWKAHKCWLAQQEIAKFNPVLVPSGTSMYNHTNIKEHMLTQKQKATPYVGVFKLHTGEELIATVIEESSSELIIKNPLCMVPTANGMQFAPF